MATPARSAAVAAVVLAAGGGSRFGGPKQLAVLGGRPLLEHALRAASASSVARVVVVLGAHAAEVARRVDLHGAAPVVCEDWERGQSASLRAGIEAVGESDAAVLALGDQPFISPRAVDRLIERRGGRALALRATYAGAPGHPVLVERELFEPLTLLSGDLGARDLLASVPVRFVPCDDLGSPADVDTPEELERLERSLRSPARMGSHREGEE